MPTVPTVEAGRLVGVVDRASSLASVSATREVLDSFGLSTKHELGQNFLINDDVIKKIVELSEISDEDYVLEVGPGIGTLTEALLKNAGKVVSVERDRDLPAVLAQTLKPWSDKFALIGKDALDLSLEDTLAPNGDLPNKFVSNLPYAVAATIVLDFFQRFENIDSATVMVQKEVAERMMAVPGTKTYGAYTVKLSLYAKPVGKFTVSPGNFFPPPHVDSMVIRLDRTPVVGDDGMTLTPIEVRAASVMADAAFATRRKTISNSCKTFFSGRGKFSLGAGADGVEVTGLGSNVAAALSRIFESCDIDPRRRGETLDRSEFVRMGKVLIDTVSDMG